MPLLIPVISVGVLEDKSSSPRIIEDNFEVLGLGLESRVLGLGLGLVTKVLGENSSTHFTNHCSAVCCVLLKLVLKDLLATLSEPYTNCR